MQPVKRRGYGRTLFIVLYEGGELAMMNPAFVQEITDMSSVLEATYFFRAGDKVVPTINCFTWGGIVILYNEVEATLIADYTRIREMEEKGLFILK